MELNSVSLVDRHNRPTVLQKVALKAIFINDGALYDPYDISGVTIFEKASNFTPSTVLSGNVVSPAVTSSTILMHFTPSADDGGTPGQDPSGYAPATDTRSLSGVYRVSQGEYVVVLDGTQDLSGVYDLNGSSLTVANGASAVNDYIDAWTIKFAANSDYQTLINDFHLYDDTFFMISQPLILETRNRLVNKQISLSAIENLKITTEITVQNKDIDQSIKNLFKDSVITNPQILIEKVNEDSVGLPNHVEVSGFGDTSGIIDVTSDNTMVLLFNTQNLLNHPNIAKFAGIEGTYRLVVKYTILNETIVTRPYFFTVGS